MKTQAGYYKGILAIVMLVGMATLTAINTNAQTITTDPVGYITLTAQGTDAPGGGNPHYVYLGLGMTQLPVNRGLAITNGANTLTVSNALTAGQYNFTADAHPAYFIEVTSGPLAGLLDDIVSNSTTAVFTSDDLSSFVTSNNPSGQVTYKIYPHWTLGTVFGPQNQVGLLGASTAGAADNVFVWNPNTQGNATYYFKTSGGGGTGWRSTASATINQSNAVLYVDQGIVIGRKTTGNLPIQLVGGVKLGQTISPIVGNGYTFAGNVYPAGFSLGASGLYTTNSATGLVGASTAGAADNVLIWNPSTQGNATYYFKTAGGGGTGWRSTASATVDASTNQIVLGSIAVIQRKVASPFNWFIQQPFTP
jgi:uncharacterized protein (TIGR02597 family)